MTLLLPFLLPFTDDCPPPPLPPPIVYAVWYAGRCCARRRYAAKLGNLPTSNHTLGDRKGTQRLAVASAIWKR